MEKVIKTPIGKALSQTSSSSRGQGRTRGEGFGEKENVLGHLLLARKWKEYLTPLIFCKRFYHCTNVPVRGSKH